MAVQVKVVSRKGEYVYECGRTVNGLYWLPIGCHHLVPADANRHADRLAEPYVSPLRGSDVGTPVVGPLPAGGAVLTSEVRKRASRLLRGRRR